MKLVFAALVAMPFAFVALTGCESEEKPKEPAPAAAELAPSEPIRAEESVEIRLTATVKAINYDTRLVTLQDKAGHEASFMADRRIQRLNEVKVGDEVTAVYSVSMLGELRPPTPYEAEHPIMVLDAAGRASTAADPAAAALRAVRVVTTVQAIDLPNMRVTLQGPMGDQVTIRAKNPENVKKLHLNDTIVITYTEAVGVSLDKVAPRK